MKPQLGSQYADNRLTSERFKAFHEALEILYIKSNLGGRLQFLKDWPGAAPYLFGDELLSYDRDGVKDRAHRAALEMEAESRRIQLLEITGALEMNSAKDGTLQLDYVRGVIEGVGRGPAGYMYATWLVDKFLPPPAEEMKIAPAAPELSAQQPLIAPLETAVAPIAMPEPPPAAPLMPEPEPPMPGGFDDPMEAIRPISVGAPAPAAPVSPPTETSATAAPPPLEPRRQPRAPQEPEPPPPPSKPALKIFGISEPKPEDENNG